MVLYAVILCLLSEMVVFDLVVWCSLVVYVASYFVSLLSRMVGCDLVVNLVFFKNGWL